MKKTPVPHIDRRVQTVIKSANIVMDCFGSERYKVLYDVVKEGGRNEYHSH